SRIRCSLPCMRDARSVGDLVGEEGTGVWSAACLRGRMQPRARVRARPRRRGVTLLEVLVVVAIMSLVAAAVGVSAYRHWRHGQVDTARTAARTIRGGVKAWWVTTGRSDCPTVADLIRDHVLDEDSPQQDPWGKPWRIDCSDDEVSVGS